MSSISEELLPSALLLHPVRCVELSCWKAGNNAYVSITAMYGAGTSSRQHQFIFMLCLIVGQTAAEMSLVGLEAGPRQALNIECCDHSGPLDNRILGAAPCAHLYVTTANKQSVQMHRSFV